MRRRKWVFLVLAITAFALIFYRRYPTVRRDGPISNGRHLSHWVEVLGRPPYQHPVSPQAEFEAAQAITLTGTNAFPHLFKWIQSETDPFYNIPSQFLSLLRKLNLEKLVRRRSNLRAWGADAAFELLLTNTSPTEIHELTQLMNTEHVTMTALRATYLLARSGPAGVPSVVAVIKNPKHPLRGRAVDTVFQMGKSPGAEAFVPALVEYLRDPSVDYSLYAIYALGNLQVSPDLVVPAVVPYLKDPEYRVREATAKVLAKFPKDAYVVLPALTNLLADTDAGVREAATNSIAAITSWPLTNAPAQ
jgi:hypothetical protein